jgi:uncharacterized OB-fold protein
MDNTCPQCGSKKIIPDLPLGAEVYTSESGPYGSGTVRGGGTVDVYVAGAPQAWVFKDIASGGLTARVCGECGHVELRAKNFRLLYEKYEKSRQS